MYKYKFDREVCWYKNSCNKYNKSECNHGCIRFMEMHYLMNTAGIPIAKQYPQILIPDKRDIEAFYALQAIKDDIVNFVQTGQNLYIYSLTTGNGKTTWGLKIIQKFFDEVWPSNGLKARGLLVNVPIFLTKIRETISYKDPQFEAFKNLIQEVDLVFWDDIGATNIKDFDHSNLLTHLELRKLAGKSNIFTGNHGEDTLLQVVGERLKSRIWNDSKRIQLVGRDRRGEL